MRFLSEKDRKNISKLTKKKIEETIKKKRKINVNKLFDVWSSIAIEVESSFFGEYYRERSKPWGYNGLRNTLYLYNKFIKDNLKNIEKSIFDLLNLSKNKSPQSTGKERKIPIKQKVFPDEMNEGDWYAPPGTEVHYNNIKNERNPYNIDYYRKTKIPFFKGPEDQEKFIIKNKWQELYTFGFIYGYILSWQNFVIVNWNIEKKDLRDFPDVKVKLTKRVLASDEEKRHRDLFTKYLKKYFKIKDNSDEIYMDINKSIYNSNLTQYLYAKKHNYFTFESKRKRPGLSDYYEQEGVSEFLYDVKVSKEKILGNISEGRFFNTVYNTRFDDRKKGLTGQVYNYEQFLLYTMYLEYIAPLDLNKLKINERDIFLRFAINRGKDEFLDYSLAKIF
tara:strand:- start:51 stop:1223 length:1173 start_codon:yes stop_codon:yes gene_type:complete